MDVTSKWYPISTAITRKRSVSDEAFRNALQSRELMPDNIRDWLATEGGSDWIRKHVQIKGDAHRPKGSGQLKRDGLLFLFMRFEVMEHLDHYGKFKRGFLAGLKEQVAETRNVSFKTIEHFYEKRMPTREEVRGWFREIKKDRSSDEAVGAVAQQLALHEVEVRRRVKDLL